LHDPAAVRDTEPLLACRATELSPGHSSGVETVSRRSRTRFVGRVVLAGLGVAAIAWLVREAGTDEVAVVLAAAAPFLPVVILLEGVRIGLEAIATRQLLGPEARRVPFGVLLRAQLVGYALCHTLPAGRATAEAAKAGMLAPFVGWPRGLAVATACQTAHLAATAFVAVPSIVVAAAAGLDAVAWAVAAVAVASLLGAAFVQVAARAGDRVPGLGRWRSVAAMVRRYSDAAREQPLLPPGATATITASRFVQVVEYGLLAVAVGAGLGLEEGLLGFGLHLVGASVGELVPGQLGVTEGAFRLGASALRVSEAVAVSIPLLERLPQLLWIAAGAFAPLVATGASARLAASRAD
jgi:hypothetical protein